MSWHPHSSSDYDTHHGQLQPDGTVAARCGIEFVPTLLPYDRGGTSASGSPASISLSTARSAWAAVAT